MANLLDDHCVPIEVELQPVRQRIKPNRSLINMKLTKGEIIYVEFHPNYADMLRGNHERVRWYGGIDYKFIHNINSTHAFVSSVDEIERWEPYKHTERVIILIKAIIKIGSNRHKHALREDKPLIESAKLYYSENTCFMYSEALYKRTLKYATPMQISETHYARGLVLAKR